MREFLKPNVKNILWLSYEGNDYGDLYWELKLNILKNYLHNSNFTQDLKIKQNLTDQLAREQIKLAEELVTIENKKNETLNKQGELVSGREENATIPKTGASLMLNPEKINSNITSFFKFLKVYETRYLLYSYYQNPYSEYKEILKLANDLARKNNSNFYFVHIPQRSRYMFDIWNNDSYDTIKEIVKELNIPFIDINKEVLLKEINPLKLYPFENQNHFNVEGYRKVAEYIYNFTSK